MAVQRCRAFKIERLAEGGGQDDTAGGFTEVDIGQDYLDCAGITLQKPGANTSTSDAAARVERTAAGALHFVDGVANGATGLDLSQLLNAVPNSTGAFNTLQDIRLWVQGPGDGFASGAQQVLTYVAGTPLVASLTWYTSSAQTTPIYSETYAYNLNSPLPSSITYKLYQAGTLVRTIVDTITANGPLVTSIARTWS